ncbi:MAG: hypothetical protein ABI459_10340 [Deltaproteobacteria bacterium]
MIDEGLAVLAAIDPALKTRALPLKAAIASAHVHGNVSDWPKVVALYHALLAHEDTDVVRLNLAAAVSAAGDSQSALKILRHLTLDTYQPYHATMAEVLARLGQFDAAAQAYDKAIELSENPLERGFLLARKSALFGQKKAGPEGPASQQGG